MAAIAFAVAWVGGVPFAIFWGAAALAVLWEWSRIVATAPNRWLWYGAGLVYAGATFAGPVVLRGDPVYGFLAIVLLFAVVWATDSCAYFAGRLLGGPKLWPAVSPKKTWSGAIGGLAGAIVTALAVGLAGRAPNLAALAVLAVVLSVVSQAGDLLESAIKRRFDVKDTSHLIPGHGGVMDRLDGFLVAAAVAALIGAVHGGSAQPARGLLEW
jgi:phosphatidate cytidylyltransferase